MTDSLDLPRGFYHLHLPETDSTMRCLLRPDLSARSEAFVLATTDFQTAGHGQRDKQHEDRDAQAHPREHREHAAGSSRPMPHVGPLTFLDLEP